MCVDIYMYRCNDVALERERGGGNKIAIQLKVKVIEGENWQ